MSDDDVRTVRLPARDHWVLDGRPLPVAEGEAARLAGYGTRSDLLDVVLARSARLRGLLGLELPATGRSEGAA